MRSGLIYSRFDMNLFTFEGRVHSYKNSNWLLRKYQTIPDMCKSGFFLLPYSTSPDIVVCPYCDLHLHQWTPDDIPILEHAKWSPTCPFVKRFPEGTIHPSELIMVFPHGLYGNCECHPTLKAAPFFEIAAFNLYRNV